MNDDSSSPDDEPIDTSRPPSVVVDEFRTLVWEAPARASAYIDYVASAIEGCPDLQTTFIDALAELIVVLPPEGARYLVQVLADLLTAESAMVRDKAAETVAELVAFLEPTHLGQVGHLFVTVGERLHNDPCELVQEQAGTACIVCADAVDMLETTFVPFIVGVVRAVLSEHAAERAIERASELLDDEGVLFQSVETL